MTEVEVGSDLKCCHCGQPCEETLFSGDKMFCCYGCQTVYEILDSNDLCEYYNLDQQAGVSLKNADDTNYAFLNDSVIRKKILSFDSADFSKVTFFVPSIHCISCIWLLENLRKLNPGVLHSEVNFAKKHVSVDFDPSQVKLSAVAQLLASVGYSPRITLESEDASTTQSNKSLVLKLAIAGFAFGNVMLFSFPEYLGIDHSEEELVRIFSWLNLALSIPVFFYSGVDYLTAAFKSFKQKQINIDVPIAAGLVALFLRSSYDIITATGPGYLDSFAGLVFFLLIGRWFQSKTYESLAFDRDYKSYFPLAIEKLDGDEWKPTVIYELKKGDQIKVKNMELVPADSILLDRYAYIDYSFVTGESRPVKVLQSDTIYAGGRLIGAPVTMVVEKTTSQSHLTSLWNNDAFKKVDVSRYQKIIDRAARKFTWIVMGIALATGVYWQLFHPEQMWLVLTSVLMVACPCALALAAPFTLGSMLRVFGRNQLYLKNADVIERIALVDAVIFDKTGTVTHGKEPQIFFQGELNREEVEAVKVLTGFSSHPLSKMINKHLAGNVSLNVTDFKELPGKGISAMVNGVEYKIGSKVFTEGIGDVNTDSASRVYVSVSGSLKGCFIIRTKVRIGLKELIERLGKKCHALISGDNESERTQMSSLFGHQTKMLFNQSPQEKLAFVKDIQLAGHKVMMVGDGLNDAGALKQADVGIAVTDDSGVFTPSCDGILYGDRIKDLDRMLSFAKTSTAILKTGFAISFFYNAIALTFAVTGNLTPLVAAIIMPISSVSVVGFSTIAVNFVAKRKNL